ncbi:hypothetical protein [Nannocystis sp. SCPEA4]|uniref:hypothetical protein n=1 Tax=Nannocystis sp. SCPEA4 TaxID=2996787 RepID=UPI00226EB0D6|nr:hypothetical protein [Nannocystis sp. SCPEA4]MCY1060885.1 hypothetical protein [Nannocystis sp. SCPEA4]
MTDWTELAEFPRTFASQCAPWGSVVRLVKGVRDVKGGKPVLLSGAKAFLQRLETDLIGGRGSAPDVASLVSRVLEANARHIDIVEWCRVKDDELDLSLRVYGTRGSQRLHLSLLGPIGRYADEPLPEHAKPKKPRAAAKKPAPAPAPAPVPVAAPATPPSAALVLRPLVADARPSYGDPLARDLDGRMHVFLRLPDRDAWACVDPSGAVTLTPMTTREVLRETDVGARTGTMNASLYTTAAGLVRIDHYENANGEQERVGHRGVWHAARRGLWNYDWTLGVCNGWFLRCIVHDGKATLIGVELTTGKKTRLRLPEDLDLRGAAVDRSGDGDLLRLLDGTSAERHMHLRTDKTLELEPVTTIAHGLEGAVQPVANNGWVVASDRSLRLVRPDRSTVELFTLPASFTAADYHPGGRPTVTQVGFDAPAWLVELYFVCEHGPGCRGALVFTADGTVRNLAFTDATGTLQLGATSLPLGENEHACGYAAGPAGDLAVALALQDGLSLIWSPPLTT